MARGSWGKVCDGEEVWNGACGDKGGGEGEDEEGWG